jgi:hypothetical protein
MVFSSWPYVHAVHCIILYFGKGYNMLIKVQKYLDVLIIDETAVVLFGVFLTVVTLNVPVS